MTDEVREFYDEFAESVLLQDFVRPNLRQAAIMELCDRFIPVGRRVLEIGCGAGIITKHLSARAGSVFGVDISGNNVRMATRYAGGDNVELTVADVITQPDVLESHAPFDAVVLADVIEHIPNAKHASVFAVIERVLSETGRVLLTYPSPEYQAHLTAHEPESRQVIDESIELKELLAVTTLRPIYFTYRSIFHENQYIHLVLERAGQFEQRPVTLGAVAWLRFRIRKVLWRLRNRAFVARVRADLKGDSDSR